MRGRALALLAVSGQSHLSPRANGPPPSKRASKTSADGGEQTSERANAAGTPAASALLGHPAPPLRLHSAAQPRGRLTRLGARIQRSI